MRQKDDAIFTNLLNRLREGNDTSDDRKLLVTRIRTPALIPHTATHVVYANKTVKDHNQSL